MSRWPDRRAGDPDRTPPRDDGFSLVEVIVALGVTMVVMTALLPQLLVGIRGAVLANDVSAAKGVVQGQLEMMRNLPYHVAPSAERRIDVLDTYFPNLAGPASAPPLSCLNGGRYVTPDTAWSGYVTGTARRCPYEPTSGSFYRKVETVGGYVLVTDTQFLDSLVRVTAAAPLYRPVVAEAPAGYDSQGAGGVDTPVSAQVGATVTAFFSTRGTLHPVSAYTQISEVLRTPTRVRGVANARAIEVGGLTPQGKALSVTGGDANIAGSLSRSSSTTVSTDAVSVRVGTDDAVGARISAIAPPSSTSAALPVPAGTLGGGDCWVSYACWAASMLDPVAVSADGGLPNAGSATSPVEARVTGDPGVSVRTTIDPDLGKLVPLLDSPTKPLLSGDSDGHPVTASSCGPSRGGVVTGRGFMQTTATRVDTCAEAAASRVDLFRTLLSPGGVLRLTLTSAEARCTVNRPPASTARASFQLTLDYAKPLGGYESIVISRSTAGASVGNLPPLSTQVSLNPLRTLGDYIDSWALSAPTASSTGTTANASLPGALTLVSNPLRNLVSTDPLAVLQADPASVFSLALGAVSCDAEDAR